MPHAAYQATRTAHLGAVQDALKDHVARLNWSRPQIENYQQHRLRALLSYAKERSPFHARRLAALDPSGATIADLASLPIMTKQDAQQNWDTINTAPGLDRATAERMLAEQQGFSYLDGYQFFSSGGSSGVRGVYVWDWDFYISAACLAWRVQAREEQRAQPLPARLAVLTAGVPPHASTPLFDVPTAPGMQTVVIAAGAPFHEVLPAVAAAAPTHLVGYPTVIGRLARASLAGDLHIEPVRVSTNSEPLLDEDRAAITRAWQPVIHNLWGSTEIGVQAVGCGRGAGLHVCEDEVVLERVNADGVPVGPLQPAVRTLATGLANRTFPFIRYDLGDQVAPLPGDCPCGSAFARVADIGGRRDDDFRYHDVTVPPIVFRHVLGTDARISEYQVVQTPTGADILVVGAPDTETLTAAMVAALRRYGLAQPVIRIRLTDSLNRHQASGKLRRFIPLP
ncbi:phenylacetate--CoA ligase family protein [Mycobacterium paragordonae]|uniref:phenylacetate--CoA ligase family protein n=1 Tax=Mycobacterium paragordonae TaxID=1389713 RepID=UPI00105E61F9|nr:phenylacetate--CoA ligase family protein [Mycobacterium paragordonae]TDK95519.1 phenylacetate--CoA ligase family protein [Mycobacterium paragordonae]TDL07813.1 phenylacetate--CoA ligase family protein [Mycobacterium paragordonae]